MAAAAASVAEMAPAAGAATAAAAAAVALPRCSLARGRAAAPPSAVRRNRPGLPLLRAGARRGGRGGGLAATAAPRCEVETSPAPPREKFRPGSTKGFVEEMRIRAMKLHTKDQSKDGERDAQKPVAKWEPTREGYVQFLVDSKAVYDVMEEVVEKAAHPSYASFRNTGLERARALAKDLAWFQSEGMTIPEPSKAGLEYASLLRELSEKDPPAFLCHFYNVYFAHSAGGRMIGRKVAEMILDSRQLEFYKWEGELADLLAATKEKLNKAAEDWTREDKDHCLNETELSFKYSGNILRILAS
eukprot:SM000082S22893  [mRNA]  locus=s82:471914:474183:- [translate_table: standard]